MHAPACTPLADAHPPGSTLHHVEATTASAVGTMADALATLGLTERQASVDDVSLLEAGSLRCRGSCAVSAGGSSHLDVGACAARVAAAGLDVGASAATGDSGFESGDMLSSVELPDGVPAGEEDF